MINTDAANLLMIEPTTDATTPLIDSLTRKVAGAMLAGHKSEYSYRGVHTCTCGASSDSFDWTIGSKFQTNFLAVHYVACHRSDVPATELAKIAQLDSTECEPSAEMLTGTGIMNFMP